MVAQPIKIECGFGAEKRLRGCERWVENKTVGAQSSQRRQELPPVK